MGGLLPLHQRSFTPKQESILQIEENNEKTLGKSIPKKIYIDLQNEYNEEKELIDLIDGKRKKK